MSSSGLIGLIIWLAVVIAVVVLMICLLVLVVRALKKYLNSRPVHQEAEKNVCKSLGEVIRENRIRCGMTQEFVAQSLGVSRQAVSKWGKRNVRSVHIEPSVIGKTVSDGCGGTAGECQE